MGRIEWNEGYSIQNAEIDEQHKKLFEILNLLSDKFKNASNEVPLDSIIDSLVDYTKFHFSTEEEKMEKYKYPEFVLHKSKHKHFTDKVMEIKEKHDNGEVYIKLQIYIYLRDWLINHISSMDKNLGQFLLRFNDN